jgi:hypothetical protein
MLKRCFTIVALLSCMVPVAAFAGNVSSRVMTAGGSLRVGTGITQTSASGTVTRAQSAATTLTITPLAGYSVAKITGATLVAGVYTVPFNTKAQSVTVSFTRKAVAVTASAGAGGSVFPSGTKSMYVNVAVSYLLSPNAGNKVISISGQPAGAVLTDATSGATVTLPYPGQVKMTFTPAANTNVSFAPKFLDLTANAGVTQSIAVGASATLAASSNPTGATYSWTQQDGPTLGAGWTASGAAPVVPFTVAGNYMLKLTATLGSDSATSFVLVKVTPGYTAPSALQAAKKACADCHSASGVGSGEYAKWAASAHSTKLVSCDTCHLGANTGAHPGAPVTSAACESCHAAPALSQTTHPTDLTAAKCIVCHNPHDPASGIANLGPAPAHPAVTLYTFEEIGMQMAGGAKVPVQVDASGKGMPYSPKQTCGTAGCHVKNGVDYTYDKISDHAFHSSQGRSEYQDAGDGKFNATKNKPWLQSTAMVGKW